MPDNNTCPLCGHDKIDHEIRTETISDNYSGSVNVSLAYDCCQQCGTDGDFGKQNDKLIRDAIDELKAESIKDILEIFSHGNVNIASMERALELPQRTLAKWKSGASSPTAAGVTLLKFLKIFPWLVDVADCNFDFDEGQRIHIKDAIDQVLPQMHFARAYMQSNANQDFKVAIAGVPPNVTFFELEVPQPSAPALDWSQVIPTNEKIHYVTNE